MKKKKITVRRAMYHEYMEIRKVKCNSFWEEMMMYRKDPNSFLAADGIKREQDSLINLNGIQHNYVAVWGGKIIGGCTVYAEENERYYVKILYVEMEWQNKGVGTIILNELDKEFPKAKSWYLETPYRSYRNHHFYEKMGYRKVGETEKEEDGFYLFNYERVVK